MAFDVYWKDDLIASGFDTRLEAETFIGIESTQMELAEYTPEDLKRNFSIVEVKEQPKLV